MTTAVFGRTSGDDFPSYLKCMISGPPKSGKTTLLGTVPNLLFLDTEPYANNAQSIAHLDVPYKAIYSSDELRQAHFILSEDQFRIGAAHQLGLEDIQAVGIDTVDTLQAIMKRERMKSQRTTQFLRDDWNWIKEEMTQVLQAFLALPMHVFFVVHTKTKDVGTEANPRTIYLPNLEGAIASDIAGMVGYSLLSFRKEEIKPDGSGTYTKYWLRAEGDETYEYLGNRAAGRLPDIIEPDFKTIYNAAMAGRPITTHTPVTLELTTTGTQGPDQQPQVAQDPGQPSGTGMPSPAQPSAQAPAPAQPPTQAPSGLPAGMPADSEPVSAAGMGYVKKVYDALGEGFPEERVKAMNLGEARTLVRIWKAVQEDAAEGKLEHSAEDTMREYMRGQDLLGGTVQPSTAVTPDPRGTIEQVKAYVGDDLARANEVFEIERTGANRVTLMNWLESKGASHGGQAPAQPPAQSPAQPDPVSTDVQNATPVATPVDQPSAPVDTPVTPVEPAADAPGDVSGIEDQAVSIAKESLGAEVISEEINPHSKCEECGNTIDDVDLALLGKTRFGRILCVNDYLAEGRKSRV